MNIASLSSTAQNMNCPISITAFTLNCKTTTHNSSTTVLQKFSVLQGTTLFIQSVLQRYYNIIGQHPSRYSIVHPGTSSTSSLQRLYLCFIQSTESALDLTSIAGQQRQVFTRSTTVVLSPCQVVTDSDALAQ